MPLCYATPRGMGKRNLAADGWDGHVSRSVLRNIRPFVHGPPPTNGRIWTNLDVSPLRSMRASIVVDESGRIQTNLDESNKAIGSKIDRLEATDLAFAISPRTCSWHGRNSSGFALAI